MHYSEMALPDTIRPNWSVSGLPRSGWLLMREEPQVDLRSEEQETRPNEFTHIFAHPDLARLLITCPHGEIQNSLWQPGRM